MTTIPNLHELTFDEFTRFFRNMALMRPDDCIKEFRLMCQWHGFSRDGHAVFPHCSMVKAEPEDSLKAEYEEAWKLKELMQLKLNELSSKSLFDEASLDAMIKLWQMKRKLKQEINNVSVRMAQLEMDIKHESASKSSVINSGLDDTGRVGGSSGSQEDDSSWENARSMMKWCVEADSNDDLGKNMTAVFRQWFDRGAAEAIGYLYARASEKTQREFDSYFLSDADIPRYATVRIIVRKNGDERLVRGNQGRFLIFTCKGEVEKQMKFTHQASAVYYMIHLIDCYLRWRMTDYSYLHYMPSEPIDLHANKAAFCQLYRMMYDINSDTLEERFKHLLYREDDYGNIRAGRQKELHYDIKKHFAERFLEYKENPRPYTIGDNHHLAIPMRLIHFEDDARELLKLHVKGNWAW